MLCVAGAGAIALHTVAVLFLLPAVANRVLSVGDAGRGKRIAAFLDGGKAFSHVSSRGFVVYTGHFNKVTLVADPPASDPQHADRELPAVWLSIPSFIFYSGLYFIHRFLFQSLSRAW